VKISTDWEHGLRSLTLDLLEYLKVLPLLRLA
jgi:hypothetical protein